MKSGRSSRSVQIIQKQWKQVFRSLQENVSQNLILNLRNLSIQESVSLDDKNNYKYRLQMKLNDLSSVRRILPPDMTLGSMIFKQVDGQAWPQLYFLKGGSKELLNELGKHLAFKK